MKKFKFSLEALLKIRTMKEQECKTKIGKVQIEIENINNAIGHHNKGIADIYTSQEELLKEGLTGQELRYFPFFFQGKTGQIKQLEKELEYKKEVLLELQQELSQKRADLKVITNMKEKKSKAHYKAQGKKEMEAIEELVLNWSMEQKR